MHTVLILTNLDIADGDAASVVVDTPAVLLDTIDTIGIGADIVDVHDHHAIVGVDVYLVGVV